MIETSATATSNLKTYFMMRNKKESKLSISGLVKKLIKGESNDKCSLLLELHSIWHHKYFKVEVMIKKLIFGALGLRFIA
jgi:hypothetical protein